jgi:N-acetylmuramoyl-L-alanine amidase
MPRERGPSILTMALTLVGVVAAVAIGLVVAVNLFGAVNGSTATSPAGAKLASSVPTAALEPTAAPSVVAPAPLDLRPDPIGAVAATIPPAASAAPAAKPAAKTAAKNGWVVVIDPGHQAQGNSRQEPIGPGSSQTKPAVASGASGEQKINLQVSLKLRDALQARGVKVVMIRTTEDVDVPNSERALTANRNHADLFIRIHCDDVGGSSTHGLSTQIPATNQWTGPIVAPSRKAGEFIQSAAIAATGANSRGLVPRADMTGFNWAKVPTVIVEMGFLSNPSERNKLESSSYQSKLSSGISSGVMSYLQSTAR